MLKKLALTFIPGVIWAVDYSVHFIGLDDNETLKTVKSAAFLNTLKKNTPISINALRFRAESDIPDIIKAMHAHGYYEASVRIKMEEEGNDVEVFVLIDSGPQYVINAFKVEVFEEGKPFICSNLSPENLGIHLGEPVNAAAVLDAEQKAVSLMGECGYPLAIVEKREMVADYDTKTFRVDLVLNAGKYAEFGPTIITGAPHIKQQLFENKCEIKPGEPYDSRVIEKTQKKLLDTGLFSSVIITHETEPTPQLPLKIEAIETKHKSINIGASYQTFFGPGLTFGWENRNVSGLGRKLSLQGDVTARTHTGTATFFVPDFWKLDQDYVAQAQALQESIFAYHQQSYAITNRIERRIGTEYRVSLGLKLERIIVSNSVDDGTFSLLEIPLYFRWSSANELLNPTKGSTLEYKAIPSVNFAHANRYYLYNTFTCSNYFTIFATDFLVFAQQLTLNSIISENLDAVPVPKRVLGGSDTELRGYRYHTVSQLHGHKPIGGRSGIFYTFETRFRISRTIGLVPFFDIGSVYLTALPKFKEKWYKSVGMGFRYFTFLGPLRFDLAFPLDRRKDIDSRYRFLVSIGQTF